MTTSLCVDEAHTTQGEWQTGNVASTVTPNNSERHIRRDSSPWLMWKNKINQEFKVPEGSAKDHHSLVDCGQNLVSSPKNHVWVSNKGILLEELNDRWFDTWFQTCVLPW